MNLINYKETPIYRVYELVKLETERYGVPILGSEIVGLVPLDAIVGVSDFYLKLENFSSKQILEKKIMEGGNYMMEDMGIKEFLDELSSGSPTPGGGAASALVGSIAASLSSMVANLTVGKKKYLEYENEMKEIVIRAKDLRNQLLKLMDDDVEVFNRIMDAYKLPKNTNEEISIRKAKIEEASKKACEVPLTTAKLCLDVIKLANIVVEKGNKNAVSDGACSAYFADAAINGALMNVKINLKNISDENFKLKMNEEIEYLKNESKNMLKTVDMKLNEVI